MIPSSVDTRDEDCTVESEAVVYCWPEENEDLLIDQGVQVGILLLPTVTEV